MTSENERLLKNIKEEKTVNQISLDMNISNKKIFQRITEYYAGILSAGLHPQTRTHG